MPLYEYACEKCGKVFEVRQKFADAALTVHEDCGGKVDRLLSAPALHFKGSGFYITDYAKGSGGANPPHNKHEGGKSESSKSDGSKAEGSKSESSKSEGSKSDGSKSDSGSSSSTPAPATTSSASDSKS